MAESAEQPFVIQHYEYHVEQYHKPTENVHHQIVAAGNKVAYGLKDCVPVLARHAGGNLSEIDILFQIIVKRFGNEGNLGVASGVVRDKSGYLMHLVDNRGDNENSSRASDKRTFKQSCHNRQPALFYAKQAFVVLHKRLKYIRDEPRDKKW